MATTGTINNTFRTGYAIRIVWTVDSQSVANNTSTVTAKVQLVSLGASYTINSSASKTGTLTINGTAYSFTFTAALTGSQTKTIFTKTVTVAHGADGSKSCAFSCTAGINVTLSGTYYGTVSASGKGTFNTIARATTPTVSASSVNMGASITINMPRAASTFVHTLTYKFGSATGTIGSSLGTSQAWTVPLSLASQIPNGTSGTCTITCQTYSGSTLVGTKTVTFTAVVPSSVVPTISSVVVADTNTTYATKFANPVQNKSKVKVTITAAGAYSSTIKAYKTEIEGKAYTGATPTTATLTTSGSVIAKVTVTDSRGRIATTNKTITVIPYTAPQITVFNCFRSNASGVADYEGSNVKIALSYSVATANNKNTASYKLEMLKNGGTAWSSIKSGNTFTLTENTVTGAIFSPDSAYEIRVSVTDYFTTVTRTLEIPTAFTLIDFNASGRGIAFGKVSEGDGVEFGLPAHFTNGETPEGAVELTSNTDVNTLLKAGFYTFSAAVRATLLNMPITVGSGAVITIDAGEAGQKMQIAVKCSEASEIWERAYFSSAWHGWKKIYGGTGKILWSGALFMIESQTITLAEAISKQPNGIVLVFSRYSNGAAAEHNFNSFFVSKTFVAEKQGGGSMFFMGADPTFVMLAAKYLYINDTTIKGHASNDATGTATTGITYTNNGFVLRYVIGV